MKVFLTLVSVILGVAPSTQAQGWHGIKPLHSTRQDVERLVGPPIKPNGITYDLKDARVNIVYSDGDCMNGWPYGWNVKPGTVLGITLYPQPRPRLAELSIDISKSKKFIDPSGVTHYNNDDDGVSVAVDTNNYEVKVIEYYPAANDVHLRCPETAAREREIASGESAMRSPDVSYSDSTPQRREIYLSHFADLLQKADPTVTIHIIGYAGLRATMGEAEARARLAQDYLVQKRDIDATRIVIIDGGYRDEPAVELFITRRDQPKPLASPNVYPKNVQIIKDNKRTNNHPRITKP